MAKNIWVVLWGHSDIWVEVQFQDVLKLPEGTPETSCSSEWDVRTTWNILPLAVSVLEQWPEKNHQNT